MESEADVVIVAEIVDAETGVDVGVGTEVVDADAVG